MRQIYNTKIIGEIEQGTIINSCLSIDYMNCSVFGIIITPRCDIENNKVPSIHYLPVVSLENWIKGDFWNLFSNVVKNNLISKIMSILQQYNLSKTLFDSISYSELRKVLKDKFKPVDFTKFDKILSDIEVLNSSIDKIANSAKKQLIEEHKNVSKTIFKELKEHKRKEFYLLENWNENQVDKYYVVLMREIRRISFELSKKISFGLYAKQISESEWNTNDLFRSNNPDNFIYSLATLKSPHLEHMIQHFFMNFGRIGVENHAPDLETMFHEKINQIY